MSAKQVLLPLPVFIDAVDGKLSRNDIRDNHVNVRIPKYEGMAVGDWVTVPAEVEPLPDLEYPIILPETFEVTEVGDLTLSIRPPWESKYWLKVKLHYHVRGAESSRVQVEVA